MPWVEQLPSGNWRAGWRDRTGQKGAKGGFTTRAAAKRYAGDQETEAREGRAAWGGRAPRWDQWRDVWLSRRRVESSTLRQDTIRIDRYLTPRWGSTRLNQIRRSDVQAWVNELVMTPAAGREGALLSSATVDRIFRLFSASLKAAVLDEAVPLIQNPCTGVRLPPAPPGHERFLSRAEVDRIASYLDGHLWAAWLLLCHTGLRFGELAGLHWQRVDLEHGLIHVVETWDSADRVIKAYPKSRKGRSVPIDNTALDVLGGLLERETAAGSCGLTHRGGAKCRSGLVVHTPTGTPLDGHNFIQRQFATAVAAAKVPPLRLHDARHTYASWLVQAGVRLEEVQRLLGHASLLTTQRYAHLGTTQNEAVLRALNGQGA